MSAPTIVTRQCAKASPLHRFDWEAWQDSGESDDARRLIVGYGRTEGEAINDLILQLAANFGRLAAKERVSR